MPLLVGKKPNMTRTRVFSEHLILLSSYFKRMIQGPWKEAKPKPESNCHIFNESDWSEKEAHFVECYPWTYSLGVESGITGDSGYAGRHGRLI